MKILIEESLKPAEIIQVMQKTKKPTENLLETKNKIYAEKPRVKTKSLSRLSPMVQLKPNISDSFLAWLSVFW